MYDIDFELQSKTDAGRQMIARSLSQTSCNFDTAVDEENWKLFHDTIDKNQFNYLRKIGEHELPVIVRHVPIQRPFCERLVSRFENRPFRYTIMAINKKAVIQKHKENVNEFVGEMMNRHTEINYSIIAKIQQFEQQKSLIREKLNTEVKTPEEQQQKEMIQQMLPQIEASIDSMIDQIQNTSVYNKDQLQKWEKYFRYEKQDLREQLITKKFNQVKQELQIKRKAKLGFISSLVTGRYAFLTHVRPGDRHAIFENLNISNVFYPQTDTLEWIHKGDYCGFKERMSYGMIMRNFGHMMSKAQKDSIKGMTFSDTSSSGVFVKTSNDGAIFTESTGPVTGQGTGIEVIRVWWKAGRWIRAIQTPNPYRPGKYFTNFLHDDDKVIDELEFKYDDASKSYVSKSDPEKSFGRRDVKPYNTKKGQRYESRYVDDCYFGIVIGSVVIQGLEYMQLRPEDDLSTVYLPIVGPAFNNITNQPYSPVNSTKELQFQYDLVTFHEEKMMALSGTKTLLHDKLQKPDYMTDSEWEYQLKLGNLEVQTKKAGLSTAQSSFNTWTVLDLSLSNSIQYLGKIKDKIKEQIGLLFGLTPQAMGQTSYYDQVGTFELSQQSSDLITEALYSRFDDGLNEAMNMVINIYAKFLLDDGDIFTMIDPEKANSPEFVKIDRGIMTGIDFYFLGYNNNKEERGLAELKSIVLKDYSAGKIDLESFVKVYSIDNLKELEKYAQYIGEQTRKLNSESFRGNEQAKAEAQAQILQLKADLEMKVNEQANFIKQLDLQIKDQGQKIQNELNARRLALDERRSEQDVFLKVTELSNEKESEDNVVMSNDKHMTVDERLRGIEIALNAIIQKAGIESGHILGTQKIKVEHEKVRKQVKEHVSDR